MYIYIYIVYIYIHIYIYIHTLNKHMCWYLGIFRFKDQSQLHRQVRGKRLSEEAELHSKQAAELRCCGAGWKVGLDLCVNGHSRNRFIGTDSIYFRPIVYAYVREYRPKIWPKIWYSTSILGSWNDHRSVR